MLLDSNLIIYAACPEHEALRRLIAREAPYVSVISKVETLGYHELGENERRFLEAFFDAADVLPVSQSAVAAAIRLRQRRRMSLGDALIAGTALSPKKPSTSTAPALPRSSTQTACDLAHQFPILGRRTVSGCFFASVLLSVQSL